MRPVTEGDEIFVTKHGRYKINHSYRTIALLSRVILRLGALDQVPPEVIEKLYEEDLKYLVVFYNHINEISVLP